MLPRWSLGITVVTIVVLTGGCGGGRPGLRPQGLQKIEPASSDTVALAQGQYLGDMDGDGNPTVGDAIKILRIVVGLDDNDPNADANQNGGTDVGDAIMVLRCEVGLDPWPIGAVSMALDVTILSALSQEPVAGASVDIDGTVFLTGADGKLVGDSTPGTHYLTISGAGYETWEGYMTLTSDVETVLYLVPAVIGVTDDTVHDHMGALVEIGFTLTPILTEFDSAAGTAAVSPASDPELNSFASLMAEVQAVEQLSDVASDIVNQIESIVPQANTTAMQIRPAATDRGWDRVEKGAKHWQGVKERVLNGEDVAEVNAWLATHPVSGCDSLACLRGKPWIPMERVVHQYFYVARGTSGLGDILGGGIDIVVADYVGRAFSLIGGVVRQIWGVAKGLLVSQLPAGVDLAKQFISGVEKSTGNIVHAETVPDGTTTVQWPEGEWDIIVSGGSSLPAVRGSITVPNGSTVTFTHPGTNGGGTPGAYVGLLSGTTTESNWPCEWEHNAEVTITIQVSGNGILGDPYTGTMEVTGSDVITLLEQTRPDVPCDPRGAVALNASSSNVGGSVGALWAGVSDPAGTGWFYLELYNGTLVGNSLVAYALLSGDKFGQIEGSVTLLKTP